MEKNRKNHKKKKNTKLERASPAIRVERRGESDGRTEESRMKRKRKKQMRIESGDSGNGGGNSDRMSGSKRRVDGHEGADAEHQGVRKRRRVRGQRAYSMQSDKNVAAGVGINAGFTMFSPREGNEHDEADVAAATELVAPATGLKPARFLDKMRARLSGGQFRMLNETLYTCKGEDAYKLFKRDPAAFSLYHNGYQEQMSRWPVLPVDIIINWLRCRSPKLIVADFGCGDARLAKSIKNKVFSLDLMSTDPSVIACNMAQTPLNTASVDVAVFCLSLMGTDYPSFIQEANRVLKPRGLLLIAEVRSRFDSGNGGASPQQFIGALQSRGFFLISQDVSNKMFIMFYLQKEKGLKDLPKRSKQWPELKACIYKRR